MINHKVFNKVMMMCVMVILSSTLFTLYQMMDDQEPSNFKEQEANHMRQNNGIAIIYFSATGTTKTVAQYIQEFTNGDMIEIEPKTKYTNDDLNYQNHNSRANQEQNNKASRPEMATAIDITSYDTIYLGFPIWWGDVPKIILTFLDTYDFKDKTVIPFCTSGGSSMTTSMNTLKTYNQSIHWLDGKRFTATSKQEVIEWIKKKENNER